ncbi:FAD-dependent oxidoreductase [Halorussus aquaticus]|uniref:FAD-dependent oxidoreductase n=1 Tax=Halorussus aquaticus TaxID=2953748 RepID=A0ABD5PZQ5_9EURY|nr:FAD-dependent oxidoreductase [Halorussus aquaticus]
MSDRFLVVGGDAAGMSAAGKAKRDDPDREVVVFERGDWVSYGACGLPYYVKGEIADVSDLVVVEPRKLVEERGIDLRRQQEVVGIDPDRRTVTVEYDGERYEEAYDDLLLATGGRAALPDAPGTDLDGVFAVRNLEAGRALRSYVLHEDGGETATVPAVESEYGAAFRAHISEDDTEVVAVVGANKIGLEMAEAFVARGFEVHVFEAGPHVLPVFGPDVAGVVADHLRERGVTLHLDTTVERLDGEEGRVAAVETNDERTAVDAVLSDVGVEPDTELAASAGLELGANDAVRTDEFGRTDADRVYAAGDCAETRHLLTGERVHWPYALAANRAGRAVGRTVAGTPTPTGGIVGTNVMKAFDREVSRTGLDDEQAREAGFDPVSTTITTITRAHYYPGWSRIVVHATADADSGRLLGASMVGAEGAAHRINSVAAALHARLTVREVGSLDFGYAPPFGPVWDPVLLAAKALGEKME